MPTTDICDELTRVLDEEAARLTELRDLLAEERAAFVALRPSEMTAGAEHLTEVAEVSSELAARRDRLVADLGQSLGRTGEIRLRELLELLPASAAERLRSAAERARAAAIRVRVEIRVGERLLDFSRQSNELLVRALHGCDDRQTGVYDRNARRIGVEAAHGPGLLSGTV